MVGGYREDTILHGRQGTSIFNVLDKSEIQVDTYMSWSPDGSHVQCALIISVILLYMFACYSGKVTY